MAKMNIWSSGAGIIAMLFMVAATVGAVFQFIFMYLPYFNLLGTTEWQVLLSFILSIAGMAFGGLAIIFSIFGIPKVLWAIFAFLVLACLIVFPIIVAIDSGVFVYIDGVFTQVPFGVFVPENPMLDFIGFWMATAGGLVAMILGLFTPTD